MKVMNELTIYNFQDDSQSNLNPKIDLNNVKTLINKRRCKEGEKPKSKEELSREYLSKGIEAFKNMDFQNAYDLFSLSIHWNEESKESYFNRGVLSYNVKSYIESMKDMTTVLEFDKKNPKAYTVRAMCLKNLGYHEVAIIDFQKAMDLEIIFKNYMIMGICFDTLDDIQNALKNYTEYLKYDTTSSNAMSVYHNRAQIYFQTMKYQKSIEDLTEAILLCQDSDLRIELKLLRGKCKKILGIVDEKIDIEEYNLKEMYNDVITLIQSHEYSQAFKNASALIEISGKKDFLFFQLRGLISKNMNNNTQSIQDFESALELNPKDLNSLKHLPALLIRENQMKKAEFYFMKLVELNPQPNNYFDRALFYFEELDEADLAIDDLTKCILLDPKFLDAYYNRGSIYLKIEKFEEAKRDFDHCLSINFEPEALVDRAICLYNLDDLDAAKLDFEKALSIDPGHERANHFYDQITQ
jgi:tetratricopeptide (TPR) repeat protein